mmetsp:Transcript_5797/g.13671  ORF Transcript_5797/g.13671 Transcript_5797/m.13671 type:complete len:85 (+) Transcript_5797:361-615(+)
MGNTTSGVDGARGVQQSQQSQREQASKLKACSFTPNFLSPHKTILFLVYHCLILSSILLACLLYYLALPRRPCFVAAVPDVSSL